MTLKEEYLKSEAAVIGILCVNPELTSVAMRYLTADDFEGKLAKAAYEAAVRMEEKGEEVDPIAIAESIGDAGTQYIAGCMQIAPHRDSLELHCGLVLKGAKRRKLTEIASGLDEAYYDFSSEPDEVLADAYKQIENINSRTAESIIQPENAVENWKAYYQRVSENADFAFCKTGFKTLDMQLGGGMFKQGLYIIGARPGMGKTTLALNIAANIAKMSKPVLFVSLEMSHLQIVSKIVALETQLSYTDLMTGRLDRGNLELANMELERFASLPFSLVDRSAMTSADIVRAARQTENVAAVVVDYLGLIKPSASNADRPRYEQMTAISAELKAAAKSLGIPVLVLCQLNRETASRAGSRPQLTDLRDSGAIEQDADAVILLHRKDYYECTKGDYNPPAFEEIELIVAKNRHASTGVVKLGWIGRTGKIAEYSNRPDEPASYVADDQLPF